ncbi:MAG: hypothetical protein A3C43_09320 [Candidatus Schekmanbacteria bacterium RIFCSPHIGHO2_02_FULL_38_11]|uniref:Uncharacterized protein n=1 Tax=Candidatus Schekmanbacteria bacterium RIFCSPLOWO2_12_FULL_38_15 TaxID=1817883 RepID=A0A1F7SE56_9BACT|nr:MAG: hypothetical protein A2043_00740 [Candidatus Schekmanbacteria bacterium GWA2_38_9]OGL49088.1 MAG: hypothetical protein A3H37_03905 [Candidatus Schekmanbacteria bacterium RIFCSPLOWO2_02_FULL_38_14]OGL49213.1 MAG: hypothetical protein A3C43_09320 [Candidatus Schekmanbacteria bacterium RIFCSPHIGHO2_02_FULL_38_11]OGL52063.1 MAG: hypothetical protein A3G31_06490 [Candidatus Schekmanbacteria bacterium RIFCSPLOWO2_12_FULL_38_15]
MSDFIKNLKYGANALVLSITILSIIIILNFFSSQYHFRWDFTKSEKYSLSEQTKKVLSNLSNDINIICFFQEEAEGKDSLKDMLREYSYSSGKIKYEFIDPDKNPKVAKRYNISEYNTVLIESNGQVNRIKGTSEQDITNAIIRIKRKTKKIICFVEGHGEKDIDASAGRKDSYSILKDFLVKQNYEARKISLLALPSVPDDCSVIVVSGPKKEFFPKEKESLNNYFLKGGRAFLLLDPDSSEDLVEFLKEFGVKMERDFIVDKTSQVFGGDIFVPVANTYGNHEITKNFHYPTFYPLARTISSGIEKGQENLTFTPLAMTSGNSWAKKNSSEKIEFNPKEDLQGPLVIGCVVTKSFTGNGEKDTRIVIFGDSDFISNAYFNLSGNGDLFLNSINWLAEEKDLISIRPKTKDFSSVQLTKQTGYFIFYFSVIILPSLVLILGGVIWIRRRKL